jgi:hypothetical protein
VTKLVNLIALSIPIELVHWPGVEQVGGFALERALGLRRGCQDMLVHLLKSKSCRGPRGDFVSEEEFVAMRSKRGATLAAPRLLLPSIQVNIRAGKFPPKEANGVRYLVIPVKLKGGSEM